MKISFNEEDAIRIYEWRLALKQGMGKSCCEHCDLVEKDIKKFIGVKSATFIRKVVNKYPYFVNGKRVKH